MDTTCVVAIASVVHESDDNDDDVDVDDDFVVIWCQEPVAFSCIRQMLPPVWKERSRLFCVRRWL